MIRIIVVQIKMQLAITLAELLLLNEKSIVHQAQCVEDVKFEFLGQDQRIIDERV